MHQMIPVSELEVGDELVGVGVVRDATPYDAESVPQVHINIDAGVSLWVPPTFMCTVDRKPKVWRRTIVVTGRTERAVAGEWKHAVSGGSIDVPTVDFGKAEQVDAW